MQSDVQLYDAANIDSLKWPENEIGLQAKGLLYSLVKDGVDSYVSNVKTRYCLLVLDDLVIPITINEKEYDNSYVVSNYFAIAGAKEWFQRAHPKLYKFQRPFLWSAGKILQWLKINRVVMVNNWLFATNLYPQISSEQASKIATFLRQKFSDYAYIFRGINVLKGDELYVTLKEENYHLIGIRHVYIYDPSKKESLSSKVHYHHRRDLRLVEVNGYEVIGKQQITNEDLPRLIDLYRQIYVDKYTSFSPAYTEKFLQKALENNVLDIVAVRKNGIIDGVLGIRVLNGMMTVPFFGYETSYSSSVGLYRMMSVLAIKEAEKRGAILNDSSGAATPKKFRGLKPHAEYIAIYDRHLPFNRRILWTSASAIVNSIVFPLMKKR